jgi:hypothetical protein
MRSSIILSIFIPALMIWAGPASAQELVDDVYARGCGDDRGADRCAASTQAKMRASYGIEDPAVLLKSGVTARRAMFVSGYGADVIAVTFIRKPGSSPSVEIRTPCPDGKNCDAPLSAIISPETWTRVIAKSENFDQKLQKEQKGVDEEKAPAMICMHSPGVVVEAIDPPQLYQNTMPPVYTNAKIRSDTEFACQFGLASPYATELLELARQNLPECRGLSDSRYSDATALSICAGLKGDKHAASEAYAISEKLSGGRIQDVKEDITDLFSFNIENRIGQLKKAWGKGALYLDAPNASDQGNAKTNGRLFFEDLGKGAEEADVALTLVREDDTFVIADFQISARRKIKIAE